MLGPWGLKVLYFYLENAAIINTVVFAYGLFLAVAHYNYSKIFGNIQEQFQAQAQKSGKKKSVEIDLEDAIQKGKILPFISGQISLIARKADKNNVLKIIEKDKKWLKETEGRKIKYL